MHKRYIFSAAFAGTLLLGTPALAQTVPPAQPGSAGQDRAPEPFPDPTQNQDPMMDQAQPGPASVEVSDTIYGSDGQPIGTIESIDGSTAILSTGTARVGVPLNAVSEGPNGPTIPLTKAEVNAQAQAQTGAPAEAPPADEAAPQE